MQGKAPLTKSTLAAKNRRVKQASEPIITVCDGPIVSLLQDTSHFSESATSYIYSVGSGIHCNYIQCLWSKYSTQ